MSSSTAAASYIFLFHGVEDGDRVVHELKQILVARDDHHPVALLDRLPGQRAQDVVGLVLLDLHRRDAVTLAEFEGEGDLNAQIVGHGRALGLVAGIFFLAEGPALGVEDADQQLGLELRLNHPELVEEAEERARGRAVGGPAVLAQMRVVSPIELGVAVDEVECWGLGGHDVRVWGSVGVFFEL
ncbi:MAG: hypothetical protein M5U26_26510 [Planctomycetota bacterium]|nr:hypothetical protein [Planctomycetota bacterium]